MTLIILEANLVEDGNHAVITEKNISREKKELLLEIEKLKQERDAVLMTLSIDNGMEHLAEQVEKMQALNAEIEERKEELAWKMR